LLERFVKEQDSAVDIEKYLRICEQLGEEPDPQKMPLTEQDFPAEVQVAFFMFNLLSDVWEGMSGTYMGKDWSSCSLVFDIYQIENRRETLYFMKLYERIIMSYRAEKAERKRKEEERKAKSGGKKYTHSVNG
jgi:hypothetical protein